ncbi:MAG: nucleoside hydrolase [Bacillota bacterium]|nr:MAG: nucleoside hydrolase [Bacillota bacterium]
MRRFLIDTDTASDDAVALLMALRHPDVQVEAITVVAGNVPVDQAVQNALYTVEVAGRPVPVYRGCDRPLLRPLETAQEVHGQDGMGDIGLPLSGRQPAPGHAVDVIIDTLRRYPGEVTVVTLGPLTNLAAALIRDPGIAALPREVVVMGGTAQGPGNVTPVAEYNIWVDPEAARIVFGAGMPLKMVGGDVARAYAVITPEEAAAIRAIGTPAARFAIDIQRTLVEFCRRVTRLDGFDLPDPIAMAIALDPQIATVTRRLFVAVECGGEWCRGQTVVDHLGVTGRPPNAEVVLAADRERFLALLRAALGAEGPR